MGGYGDARDGAIKSDANDALYLLYAVVLKYRFLANISSAVPTAYAFFVIHGVNPDLQTI